MEEARFIAKVLYKHSLMFASILYISNTFGFPHIIKFILIFIYLPLIITFSSKQ